MTHPIRLALCTFALIACGQIVAAEPAAADYRRLNLDLVDHHIVPRYARLAETTARLEEAAVRHCRALDTEGPAALDTAWREAFDAWQGVQHLRFGPGELFMRGMRMQFWPDPRNTVGRQLDELIAAGDPAVLEAERFKRLSIAVQGFPAIERLLADGRAPVGGDYRCAVLEAVAGNVADMAADTLQGWRGGERPYREVVAEAAKGAAHYQQDSEVTQALFKSLHGLMELLAEHKLTRPLGDSPQTARPQLAESWRGKRSLDNLRINLEAAEAMYFGESGGTGFSHFVREVRGDAALDDLLRRAFAQTRATAASIALPLEEAVVDPAERRKVTKLVREASALKALFAQRLTLALGIPLGFNSLDGD